jgi:hypothetical protein
MLALVVAISSAVVLVALPRRDLRLEHRGRRITRHLAPPVTWTWLTDHTVLLSSDANVNGTAPVVRIIDTRTGKESRLPFGFARFPVKLSASSDGKTVIWNEMSSFKDVKVHLDRVDGSQHLLFKSTASDDFPSFDLYCWPDGSAAFIRCIRVEDGSPFGDSQALVVRSVSSPHKATTIPVDPENRLLFSSFAFRAWEDVRATELIAYGTGIRASTWAFSLNRPFKAQAKYEFQIPGSLSWNVWIGSLSPDGTRLAFVLDSVERPPAMVTALQRMHIPIPWHPRQVQSIRVCSITGRGMHEVANVDFPHPGLRYDRQLFDMLWSPDGKQLGCMTTSGLYVVNAD